MEIVSSIIFGIIAVFAAVVAWAMIFIMIFLPLAPAFVSSGFFVNKPGQQRSPMHFFTFIEPGEVKFVVRGDTVIRGIMYTSGKTFARDRTNPNLTNHDEAYWEIVDGIPHNPADYVTPLLRWWARYVYTLTGAVFTGIYPFQRVREYRFERTSVERKEETLADGSSEDNLKLSVKQDYSDHYRLRRFNFYVHVTKADTSDKIPVDTILTLECEINNPFRAAFGIDRWDNALTNFVTDRLTQKTKTMTLDQVLTAKDENEATELALILISKEAGDQTGQEHTATEIGVSVRSVRFLQIDPRTDPEEAKALRAEAVALQQAKATRIDGEARADVIRSQNKAVQDGGATAQAVLEAETRIKMAAAAGAKGVVIMGASQGVDPIQAAQLRSLERNNKE